MKHSSIPIIEAASFKAQFVVKDKVEKRQSSHSHDGNGDSLTGCERGFLEPLKCISGLCEARGRNWRFGEVQVQLLSPQRENPHMLYPSKLVESHMGHSWGTKPLA